MSSITAMLLSLQWQDLGSDRWSVGQLSDRWLVAADQSKMTQWTELFTAGAPVDGKLTGRQARPIMMQSKLPNSVLSKIWALADVDRDGMLDEAEFCLAMYLMDLKLTGSDLPGTLPSYLVPQKISQSQSLVSSDVTEEETEEEVGVKSN